MKKTILTLICSLILLVGCAEQTEELKKITTDVTSVIQDVTKFVGDNVDTLDQVNTKLISAADQFLTVFRDLNLDMNFRENGIEFTNNKDMSGILGINGNNYFIEIKTTSTNSNTMQGIVKIVNLFSETNSLEEKITSFRTQTEDQRYDLQNGFIDIKNKEMTIYLESNSL